MIPSPIDATASNAVLMVLAILDAALTAVCFSFSESNRRVRDELRDVRGRLSKYEPVAPTHWSKQPVDRQEIDV